MASLGPDSYQWPLAEPNKRVYPYRCDLFFTTHHHLHPLSLTHPTSLSKCPKAKVAFCLRTPEVSVSTTCALSLHTVADRVALDTSCILKWLIEENYEVYAFMADVGQEEVRRSASLLCAPTYVDLIHLFAGLQGCRGKGSQSRR